MILLLDSMSKERLPWIEKYRPKNLHNVIGHDEKVETLKNLVKKKELPHLLLYGPPGTGKTSIILALAREMYGDDYKKYIMEINASSERGIDTIRGNVTNFVTTKSNKVKLVILDEADAMTNDAQSALRSVMEKYAKFSRFCLICNNISKIIPALQSRCVKMVFGALNNDSIVPRLKTIVEEEGVDITDDGIHAIVKLEKDFRQILNILQGLHYNYTALDKTIGVTEVYRYLRKPTDEDIDEIVKHLFQGEFLPTIQYMNDIFHQNRINFIDLITGLVPAVLEAKINPNQVNFLIRTLSEVEFRVKQCRESEIQIAYLVAAFRTVRSQIQSDK
jgi:replication factor C subunit 3/5